MAKANLALAYERAGDPSRAGLAAKQALGVPGLPPPVYEQARSTLSRLGAGEGDLLAVLDDEPPEQWTAIVREEVVRWADADDATLEAEARTWARAQSVARAEALLGALFELPPAAMERVLGAVVVSGGEQTREELERAAVLFHAPQELRVRDMIAQLERRRSSSAT